MNYFKYVVGNNQSLATRVWLELQNWYYFAVSLYGVSNADDALEDTYVHVLKHYKEGEGDLTSYITSVLSTIYKSKYKKEVISDEVLNIELDKKISSDEEFSSDSDFCKIEEDSINESVEDCKKLLIPMYIEDFKFLQSYKQSDKKLNYSNLRDLFSERTISKALLELKEEYDEDLSRLFNFSKVYMWKNHNNMLQDKFYDKSLSFMCTINDIVVCKLVKRTKGVTTKCIYKLNLESMINTVKNTYKDLLMCKVGDFEVWLTLSGYITYNEDELNSRLETELLCKLMSVTSNFRIVAYEKGKVVYLSSYLELENIVSVVLLDKIIVYNLEKVVLKVV